MSLLKSLNFLLSNAHVDKDRREGDHDEVEENDEKLETTVADETVDDDGHRHDDTEDRDDGHFAH